MARPLMLLLALLLGACDSGIMSPTPVAAPTPAPSPSAVGVPTPAPPLARRTVQPLAQGWVFTLPTLTQANDFQLNLDIWAPGGRPIGVLAIRRGESYEAQGKPDLIRTVQVLINANLVLELAAGPGAGTVAATPPVVARAGGQYEGTTAEGWRVRVAVKTLAVDPHPPLAGGTPGAAPVFTQLALDIQLNGTLATPYLGFTADTVTRERASLENLRGPDLQLLDHGVVIRDVAAGGPAARAGLQPGDVVLAIAGQAIDEAHPLTVLLSDFGVGATVPLSVVRAGQALEVPVTLTQRP